MMCASDCGWQAGRSLPAVDMPDRLRHTDQHECQRGHRQPRHRADGWRDRQQEARPPQRPRQQGTGARPNACVSTCIWLYFLDICIQSVFGCVFRARTTPSRRRCTWRRRCSSTGSCCPRSHSCATRLRRRAKSSTTSSRLVAHIVRCRDVLLACGRRHDVIILLWSLFSCRRCDDVDVTLAVFAGRDAAAAGSGVQRLRAADQQRHRPRHGDVPATLPASGRCVGAGVRGSGAVSCFNALCSAVLHCTLLCRAVQCRAALHCTLPCRAALHCAVPCRAALCRAVLHCIVRRRAALHS